MLPLICIDVDGTLVGSSHEPTDRVLDAVDEALARGQHLALSTGRSVQGKAERYARRIDPNGWHIFHNGAAMWHAGDDRLHTVALDDDSAATATDAARRNGWVIEYYSPGDYTVDTDDTLAVEHAALLGVPHVVRPRSALDGDLIRVQFIVAESQVAAVAAEMQAAAVTISPASSPGMPGVAFVSCTALGASKGQAIAWIAAEIGTDIDQVMMVGDGHNDVEALAAVGHGVAMGNAVVEAKQAARHHVADVEVDGLAEALHLSARL